MMKSWFLAITDLSVYRCRACRKFVNTSNTMEPLFKHLAKYHAGELAEEIAREREKAHVGTRPKVRAAAA